MKSERLSHIFSGLLGFAIGGALIFALHSARSHVRSGWVKAKPPKAKKYQTVNLKPEWIKPKAGLMDLNVSYLNSIESAPTGSFADGLLPSGRALQLRQEFDDIQRAFETRRQAGLVKNGDEAAQYHQRLELAKKVRNELRLQQLKNGREKAQEIASRDEHLAKPATVAVAVAAVGTGYPVEASLSEKTSVTASTNIPHRSSYLKFSSPALNTTLSYAGVPVGNASTLAAPPPDWFRKDERYFLSMNRGLPVWDLGAGIAYGGTSNTVSTSLSKALAPNLNAEVSRRMPVQADGSTLSSKEDTVQIRYELKF